MTQDSPETETGHLPRLMNEQLGQILVTAVGFLDRMVLTGILIRFWGKEQFGQWSVALAFAGFGSLFEFGFNLYYNNRITFETERGENDAANATLAEANSVFAITALAGCAALAVIAGLGLVSHSQQIMWTAILLSAAATLRLSILGTAALYRANRAYSRFAYLSAAGELLRITATAIAVMAGSDLIVAAFASLLAQLLIPIALIYWDSRKRFAPHQIRFSLPRGESLYEAIRMSVAYFMQMLPVILWSSAPILFLQNHQLAVGTLAGFVLVRTLANLARTPLQSFGIVIGQECGRRIAINDTAGALAALAGGARLFAVLGGLACGLIALGGPAIVSLWTGDPSIFTLELAVAAMLPMLLGAVSVLAHNVLVASNAPYLALVARWLQLVMTAITYLLMPGIEIGLRVMLSLAAGELLGYLPMAYYAVNRLIPGSGIVFHLRYAVLTIVSALFSSAAFHFSLKLLPSAQQWRLIVPLVLASIFCLIWALLFAVDGQTRARIIDSAKARVLGAAA